MYAQSISSVESARTVPWGTPDLTRADSEELPSTTTFWVLLVRKFWIHFPEFRSGQVCAKGVGGGQRQRPY